MTQPKILVTGAAGKTGSAVVNQLRAQQVPVRALVRTRDTRSDRLERLGAEVVVADLYDPEQLQAVLHGVQRAYFVPIVEPYMIQSATAFSVAARATRLESVVQISQWLSSPTHPSLHTRQLWLVEQLFSMLPGTGHTVVNPGVFAEPLLSLLPVAANLGVYPNPFGTLKNAPPSNEDIARVVVGALLRPEQHSGKRYRPTGPTLLSMQDIADILGRVVGRPVVLRDVPEQVFLKAGKVGGTGMFELSNVRHYLEDGKRGAFEVNAPNDDVYIVSGQPPETFETTARRYAALPEARRSPSNQLRALRDLMRTVLTPTIQPDRFDARQSYPSPHRSVFAADSERWHAEHPARLNAAVL